ncbi:hypothetical protein [Velocimicrobium porci]|uniref:hypothetical protein n=1 Tax=Velocimicrobium porci TaxID=2606634 RepID=UPI0012B3CE2A|nr:hypothetical protein [Velocimicrobium porci]
MKRDSDYKSKNSFEKKIKNKRVEHTELVIEDDTIYEIDLECEPCRKCYEKEK